MTDELTIGRCLLVFTTRKHAHNGRDGFFGFGFGRHGCDESRFLLLACNSERKKDLCVLCKKRCVLVLSLSTRTICHPPCQTTRSLACLIIYGTYGQRTRGLTRSKREKDTLCLSAVRNGFETGLTLTRIHYS